MKSSFNPANVPSGYVTASAVQTDGKVLLVVSSTVVRLNTDGSVDAGFNAPSGLSPIIYLGVGPYGKIVLITNSPTNSSSYNAYQLLRLQGDGSVDTGFAPATFFGTFQVAGQDFAVGIQANGKIIVGGDFAVPSGSTATSYVGMARYNVDGSLDPNFKLSSDLQSNIFNAIVPLADGRIFVAGSTDEYNNGNYEPTAFLSYLRADGSLDASYNASGAGGTISMPTLLPDGKILYLDPAALTDPMGSSNGGLPRRRNADGTIDTSFAPQFETGAIFFSMAVQANGKILIGGYITRYTVSTGPTSFQFVEPAGVLRLNADGTQDASFSTTGLNTGAIINSVALAPDSSVLVTGDSLYFTGSKGGTVAELSGDGGLDLPFFDGEVTLGSGVDYLALPDGNLFGYYSFLSDPHYLYHFDLGYEYVFPAVDGANGLYLYDFKSGTFFYTSATFPFPYLYDFTLNTVLYYYPDPNHAGRYNTNGVRYFYNFSTGKVITK